MKNKVKELEDQIIYHKNLYYRGMAKISDEAYDALEDELEKLNPDSSVLKMVGAKVLEKSKIRHDKKMLSLEKTYDEEKLKNWISDHEVLTMFKYDGSACSLIYEEGFLTVAKTRGDGESGEDIISKVLYIDEIPKRLAIKEKGKIEIRGEIYCNENNFLELSNEMQKKKLDPPNSIRNIVAGILGRKDYIELSRFLSFSAFDLISEEIYKKEKEKFIKLKKMDFKIPDIRVCTTWIDVKKEIENVQKFFSEGEFLVDGLVIVYNDLSFSENLGETSHHPKNKIAFKFKGESKATVLKNIEWNISRNGRCTPVAIVEPVELSGASVSRVTLHHLGVVEAFKLKCGDIIEIIRSGEVIPKFIRVVESSNEKFIVPKECPSCGNELIKEEHWLICKNKNCPEKKLQELLFFIKNIGIEEISFMRLKEMISSGLINKTRPVESLFLLTKNDFLKLEKVKEKLAVKFEEQIFKAKNIDLQKFVVALGIEGLGPTKVQKIIDSGYVTLKSILNLKIEDIIKIEGFAETTANAIVDGLCEKSDLIENLLSAGVKINEVNENNSSDRAKLKLYGMKFCITGTLSSPREEVIKKIKNNGGVVQDSVNKETTYLITNDKDGKSSKFIKAKKLNIQRVNESFLNELIGSKG